MYNLKQRIWMYHFGYRAFDFATSVNAIPMKIQTNATLMTHKTYSFATFKIFFTRNSVYQHLEFNYILNFAIFSHHLVPFVVAILFIYLYVGVS